MRSRRQGNVTPFYPVIIGSAARCFTVSDDGLKALAEHLGVQGLDTMARAILSIALLNCSGCDLVFRVVAFFEKASVELPG